MSFPSCVRISFQPTLVPIVETFIGAPSWATNLCLVLPNPADEAVSMNAPSHRSSRRRHIPTTAQNLASQHWSFNSTAHEDDDTAVGSGSTCLKASMSHSRWKRF